MPQNETHTELPWSIDSDRHNHTIRPAGTGYMIASIQKTAFTKNEGLLGEFRDSEHKANAEYIVKAVNSHYDMLAALEHAVEKLEWMGASAIVERAAIAKAKAEELI